MAGVVVTVTLVLSACFAGSGSQVRAVGTAAAPVVDLPSGPALTTTSTVPSTAPPSTAPPTTAPVAARPARPAAPRVTTTTRARPTTTTLPPAFEVPPENLLPSTERQPLPSFAPAGYPWNTG